MNAQKIVTPAGEELVVLARADYEALVLAAENALDADALLAFRRRLEGGEEELLPAPMVDRILDGDNPIRVWREHRGMTSAALAERAGVGQGYLSQLETGKRDGTVETMRKIAAALGIGLDDLVG